MILNALELAALESGIQRMGIFFHLATATPVRLWLGIGKIEPGVNVIDLTGATYLGFGELVDVPSFQQLVNGAAERSEFTLSGVTDAILALAAVEDAPAVRNKTCAVGIAIMGADWQLLGPVRWLRYFVADYLSVRHAVSENLDDPVVRQVVLSVGSRMTGRRRPGLSYFTDQDQQLRSPGDLFCERATLYRQEVTKVWPRF